MNPRLYILTVLAHLADALTTVIGLKYGGYEKNPLVNSVLDFLGLSGVFIWKIGILVAIYLIWQYTPTTNSPFPTHRAILILAFLGGFIPAVWNLVFISFALL